jgi:hypothetical protein
LVQIGTQVTCYASRKLINGEISVRRACSLEGVSYRWRNRVGTDLVDRQQEVPCSECVAALTLVIIGTTGATVEAVHEVVPPAESMPSRQVV